MDTTQVSTLDKFIFCDKAVVALQNLQCMVRNGCDNGNITQSVGLIKKYLAESILSLKEDEYHLLLSYNEQGIYNHFKDYISENFFDELVEKFALELKQSKD